MKFDPDFNRNKITPEMVETLDLRLVIMPTKRNDPTVYMVYASPQNAKVNKREGYPVTQIFPEDCIGMISACGTVGAASEWALFPTLRAGGGWRKRQIGIAEGRNQAVMGLVYWWSVQNEKRLGKQPSPIRRGSGAIRVDTNKLLFDAYMFAYDSFAVDTSEVAELLKIDSSLARSIGIALAASGLVVIEKSEEHGGVRVSGGSIRKSRGNNGRYAPDIWQCYETYDYIDRLQAIDLFVEKAHEVSIQISEHIANEMKRTREEKIDVYNRIK